MGPPLLVRLGLREANPWEPPTVLDRLVASPLRATGYFLWRLICWLRSWGLRQRSKREKRKSERSEDKKSERSEDKGSEDKKSERSEDKGSEDKKSERSEDQRSEDQRGEDQGSERSEDPKDQAIRVVCLSDTHDQMVADVPAGDVLIHAGDLTNAGTPADLQRQVDWLAAQPHRHKVVVGGNHDSWLDPAARAVLGRAHEPGPVFPPGVHYLEHSAVTLDFPDRAGGRQLTVYGAPDIPRCGPDSFAFQYDRQSPPWENTIPTNLDILITHPPPRHHRDLNIGCYGLLREIWRVRPRLHVFGHVHWGAGREVIYWDAAQRAYEAVMDDREVVAKYPVLASVASALTRTANLVRLLVHGLLLSPVTWLSVLPFAPAALSAKGPAQCTVLVNAAQMYGNTGRLGTHNTQVVDL